MGTDKGYIREVFIAVSIATKQVNHLYSISDDNAGAAINKVMRVFRNPAFQNAVKSRTALSCIDAFCTLKRSVELPHPILVDPIVRVGKVGCGKGSHQLYMTHVI